MTSGPVTGPYRPRVELVLSYTTPSQQEIGRSVGLGIVSTLCGRYQVILVISVFVPGLSELYMYVWMDYDPWRGPCHPQMAVTLCTIPGQ